MLGHVVASRLVLFDIVPIVRVVLGLLLPVNKSYSVDVVILVVVLVFVPSHYQLLFCSF